MFSHKSFNVVKVFQNGKAFGNLFGTKSGIVSLDPIFDLIQIISPSDHAVLAYLLVDADLFQSLRVAFLELRDLSLQLRVGFLQFRKLTQHLISFSAQWLSDFSLFFYSLIGLSDLLFHFLGLGENIVDEVLTRLKAFRRQSPEESADSDFISLHQIVIHQALVNVLDSLQHYRSI